MKEFTPMRYPSAAPSVITNASNDLKTHERIYNVINHSAAQSVTKHSKYQVIGKLMKESILIRNHTAAQSVTRNLPHQVL